MLTPQPFCIEQNIQNHGIVQMLMNKENVIKIVIEIEMEIVFDHGHDIPVTHV